jgi:hypothetical protein
MFIWFSAGCFLVLVGMLIKLGNIIVICCYDCSNRRFEGIWQEKRSFTSLYARPNESRKCYTIAIIFDEYFMFKIYKDY